jgi:hypothetical protein
VDLIQIPESDFFKWDGEVDSAKLLCFLIIIVFATQQVTLKARSLTDVPLKSSLVTFL